MKVGDLVGYIHGDGPTGIVLSQWIEAEPGIGVEESWCRILWSDDVISEHAETRLEKIYESR